MIAVLGRLLAGMIWGLVASALLSGCAHSFGAKTRSMPIIDVHLHTVSIPPDGVFLPNPVTGQRMTAKNDKDAMQAVLAEMKRFNVVKAIISGPLDTVLDWGKENPDRFICGILPDINTLLPPVSRLRQEFLEGHLRVLGELTLQYAGIGPEDPRLEPYFALAEELDIPVAFHTGSGPPEMAYHGAPKFRLPLGNPLLLEDVLVRHPKLRVWICHGGADYLQETCMLMSQYPQVYADVSVINWIDGPEGREWFHGYLKALLQHGFGKRLMFGSDQMSWPDAIGLAIEGIESAKFMSPEQKRDIFYDNAVRFFKLYQPDSTQKPARFFPGALKVQ